MKPYTCDLNELAFRFDEIMFDQSIPPGKAIATGFTIGKRGKQLHWYLSPTQNGMYRCYPLYENGEIGQPRYYEPATIVIIHYQQNVKPTNRVL